jgi:hypothetical protein
LICIKGQIIDAYTKIGIDHASIRILNKGFGVIANNSGYFIYNISNYTLDDSLSITSLGYSELKISIKDVGNQMISEFALSHISTTLKEFEIKESMTAQQIIKHAIKNYEINYPDNPYLTEGYFREFTKKDSLYIRLFEASVGFYDDTKRHGGNSGYFEPPDKINSVRYIESTNFDMSRYYWTNSLKMLLMQCRVTTILPESASKNLYVDSTIFSEGEKIYIVSEKDSSDVLETNTYYVNANNYAIIKVSVKIKTLFPNISTFHNGKSCISAYQSTDNMELEILFSLYNAKYYPKYLLEHSVYGVYENQNLSSKLFTLQINTDLTINSIEENANEIPTEDQDIELNDLITQKYSIDDNFWKDYNYVVDDSIKLKAVDDIKKTKKKIK